MKKDTFKIELNETDLYWIQTLLYEYIESNESNFHQKIEVLVTLNKLLSLKNCGMYIDKDDLNNLEALSKKCVKGKESVNEVKDNEKISK
jgi:hypothetical protein